MLEIEMPRRRERYVPAGVKEVLAYFLRNPDAADDLEGVARWRLLDERVHRGVEEADAALAWLVAAGFLVEERGTAASPVFRLSQENVRRARSFVTDRPSRRPRPPRS